ncbi:MAG TPA: FUSC family protein, partial [Candidatus Binatia bacterium]|nr:FUSC family protein [Candidatus Binatia bacterium]
MIRHTALDWWRGRRRLRSAAWRLAEPPAPLPPVAVQAIKVAVASGLAWGIGQALHSPRPFAAVLAVIILMAGHAYSSLLNALHFVIGVVGGLLLGIIAVRLVGASTLFVAALVFICMLIGGWLRVSRHSNQIAVSALLVLATGSADNVQRLWETALGGAVGVVVASLLWPPNPVRGLRQQYHEARARIREDVLRTIEVAGGQGDAEANRRRVRENAERADRAVAE